MLKDQRLAFLDIETTGLSPFEHQVLEVAYVRELPGESVDETHFSLPINEYVASPEALEINKYHERKRELQTIQINPIQAARQLQAELVGCMLVGANPTFDATFLRTFIWQHIHEEPTWYYRVLDLNSWASGWLQHNGILTTPYIAEQFNVPLGDDQHTALADARWNRDIYHAVTASWDCVSSPRGEWPGAEHKRTMASVDAAARAQGDRPA